VTAAAAVNTTLRPPAPPTNDRSKDTTTATTNSEAAEHVVASKLPNLTSSVFGFICFVVWQRGNERSHQQQQPNDDSLIEFGMYRLWLATFSRG